MITVQHHVPKCMSCHKAIVVINGRAHCFHDNKYITLILLLLNSSTLYVVGHLWPLILCSLLSLLSTLFGSLVLAMCNRTSCVQVRELPKSHCGDNCCGDHCGDIVAHCFHDYIYVKVILLLWDLSTLCVVDHLWLLTYAIYM